MTRGMRNNNPLNIRFSPKNHWRGLAGSDGSTRLTNHGAFCRFDTLENGFRAAFLVIHRYLAVHGLKTVKEIVSRWAPEIDNDTEAYIYFVCKRMNGSTKLTNHGTMDKVLDFHSSDDMCALVGAMAQIESGDYDKDIIRKAYDMVRQSSPTIAAACVTVRH